MWPFKKKLIFPRYKDGMLPSGIATFSSWSHHRGSMDYVKFDHGGEKIVMSWSSHNDPAISVGEACFSTRTKEGKDLWKALMPTLEKIQAEIERLRAEEHTKREAKRHQALSKILN